MSILDRLRSPTRSRPDIEADPLTAIDELAARNRKRRNAEDERLLVDARHLAFRQLTDSPNGSTAVVPADASGLESRDGMPVVPRDQLTPELAAAAVRAHGCALVPGLLGDAHIARLIEAADRAIAARANRGGNRTREERAWFRPFKPSEEFEHLLGNDWNRLKADGGTLWTADSPRAMFELTEVFEEAGLTDLARGYLGARPVMSLKKCNLRRVSLEPGAGGKGAEWHQDGRFLGTDLDSPVLNFWITLSPCGVDAPGLDIVPKRLDRIAETGGEGALFDWTVSPQLVDELAQPKGVIRPQFEAGDALLFDHLFLHRSGVSDDMTKARYAVETWLFSAADYPTKQVPLVL